MKRLIGSIMFIVGSLNIVGLSIFMLVFLEIHQNSSELGTVGQTLYYYGFGFSIIMVIVGFILRGGWKNKSKADSSSTANSKSNSNSSYDSYSSYDYSSCDSDSDSSSDDDDSNCEEDESEDEDIGKLKDGQFTLEGETDFYGNSIIYEEAGYGYQWTAYEEGYYGQESHKIVSDDYGKTWYKPNNDDNKNDYDD